MTPTGFLSSVLHRRAQSVMTCSILAMLAIMVFIYNFDVNLDIPWENIKDKMAFPQSIPVTDRLQTDMLDTHWLKTDKLEAEKLEKYKLGKYGLETDTPKTDRLETDIMETKRLETHWLETDKLETDTPKTDTLETDKLETDTLKTDTLKTDKLETDKLETDKMETDKLETDMPETDMLEKDKPKTDRLKSDRLETYWQKKDGLKTDRPETDRLETDKTKGLKTDKLETDRPKTDMQKIDWLENDTRKLYMHSPGRTGNAIFNFVGAYSLARSTHRSLVLTPRMANQLKDVFYITDADYDVSYIPENITYIKVKYAKYDKLVKLALRVSELDILVCCYLQSWKYFIKYKRDIRRILQIKPKLLRKASTFIKRINVSKNITLVGIHVRRGDYTEEENQQLGYALPPNSYIKHAMDLAISKYKVVHFIIASNGIKWCKKQKMFRRKNVTFSEYKSASFDMALLSQCNHVIITVGTFGWWAGWLAGGDVMYYNKPVRDGTHLAKGFLLTDYYPPWWIGLGA